MTIFFLFVMFFSSLFAIWHFKVAIGLGLLAAVSLSILLLMILIIVLVSVVLSKFFHIPLKKQLRKCVVIPVAILLGFQLVVSVALCGGAVHSFIKSSNTDIEDDFLYEILSGGDESKKSDSDRVLPNAAEEESQSL